MTEQLTTCYGCGALVKDIPGFTWLEPPIPNGRITVRDVVQAGSLAEHQQLVWAWARDVWQAWASHHAYVRSLARLP